MFGSMTPDRDVLSHLGSSMFRYKLGKDRVERFRSGAVPEEDIVGTRYGRNWGWLLGVAIVRIYGWHRMPMADFSEGRFRRSLWLVIDKGDLTFVRPGATRDVRVREAQGCC